jgi:hypothetical protein
MKSASAVSGQSTAVVTSEILTEKVKLTVSQQFFYFLGAASCVAASILTLGLIWPVWLLVASRENVVPSSEASNQTQSVIEPNIQNGSNAAFIWEDDLEITNLLQSKNGEDTRVKNRKMLVRNILNLQFPSGNTLDCFVNKSMFANMLAFLESDNLAGNDNSRRAVVRFLFYVISDPDCHDSSKSGSEYAYDLLLSFSNENLSTILSCPVSADLNPESGNYSYQTTLRRATVDLFHGYISNRHNTEWSEMACMNVINRTSKFPYAYSLNPLNWMGTYQSTIADYVQHSRKTSQAMRDAFTKAQKVYAAWILGS